ncbi:MAG: response regulator [Nitrospiria bacterium]
MVINCPNCQTIIEIHPAEWSSETGGIFGVECSGCQASLRVALKVDLVEKKPVEEEAVLPSSQFSMQEPVRTEEEGSPETPAPVQGEGQLSPLPLLPSPVQRLGESDASPSGMPETASPSPKILVAVDGEATRELIRDILGGASYEVLETSSGREALALLEKHHPPLALLDVGLSQMFGFEVCEVIKRNESLKSIKVILVAAIHSKNGYRREPNTLYSAEDYIERHRLQGELLSKVEHLLDKKKASPFGEEPEDTVIQLSPDEDLLPPNMDQWVVSNDSPEHESARRFARIIVSDIALYNSERVKEALQKGNFYEMLKEEIVEGRKLYNERVPVSVRNNTDYLHDALEAYLKNNKLGPT